MVPPPSWMAGLLTLLAVVAVVLLALVAILAVHRMRAAAPEAAPPAARPSSHWVRRAVIRLAALTGSRSGIDAVPLLIVVGADSLGVQRLVPDLMAGNADLARAQQDLFSADCRMSLCRSGAIVSFTDGLLASERWATRWAALIKALGQARADQPFDGLVIALPADKFFGPDKLADDDLVVLGEQLYALIWTAQRDAGWTVPVYLVLNRCEVLTGFSATVAALPGSPSPLARTPFGWAVPFALASAFERRWVNEGIDALVARLSLLQSRLLMQAETTESAEQMLLFPEAVAALESPLALLLTPMLRPSAYHEAFMFRGFYFTGQPDRGADHVPDAFSARLFADTIFPEHVLARPANGAMTRRRRRIRTLQAALAVSLIAAVVGLAKVRGDRAARDTTRPLLDEIASLGHRVAARQAAGKMSGDSAAPAAMDYFAAAESQQLLMLMSGVSVDGLETWWAPLSLASGADTKLQDAIRGAYNVAVLREVGDKLTHQVPQLLQANERLPGAEPATAAGLSCAAAGGAPADVERLRQLTIGLTKYTEELHLYQGLTTNPQINDLQSLLDFALSVQLPSTFRSNNELYVSALSGAVAPALDIASIRRSVASVVQRQFTRALNGAYPASPLGLAVDGVLANAGDQGATPPVTNGIERLQRLSTALHAIEAQSALPDYGWLRDGTSVPALAASLTGIAALTATGGRSDVAPVDSRLPSELRNQAEDCLNRTRRHWLDARVFGDVPVLRVGDGAVGPSPPLRAVMASLDAFLVRPLVTAKFTPAVQRAEAADAPLFWNQQDLESLQMRSESYLLYASQDLSTSLPPAFRQQVLTAAGERLGQLVGNATARARGRGAERTGGQSTSAAALRDEIARFADAVPVLTNVISGLRDAGLTNSAEDLEHLLFGQATRLLLQVDTLLTRADPYQLVDPKLAFWSGAPPLAAAAFSAATLPELVGSLPARRDYVEALARDHAAPLVNYLRETMALSTGRVMAAQKRWQGILDTFDRYHRGDPANALSRLEQFIAADMDRIDIANCGQILALPNNGADWFAEQLGRIRSAVAARCGHVGQDDATSRFDDLADTFNRDLAGRFPFGGPGAPNADLGDVKRFFNRFGGNLTALRTRLATIGAYTRAGAVQFLDQLIATQAAMAPMLSDPVPDAPLTYDVTVEFRTNIGSDPGADQIAEATIRFGQRSLSSFDPARTTAWTSGQPVQLLLRWATNAPGVPVGDDAGSPRVSGLLVKYEFTGPWALLRLLTDQRPPPAILAQLSDRRPGMVGFILPLKHNPDAVGGGDTSVTAAHLFMRFDLNATLRTPGQPDQHAVVALPAFPVVAPRPGASAARTAP